MPQVLLLIVLVFLPFRYFPHFVAPQGPLSGTVRVPMATPVPEALLVGWTNRLHGWPPCKPEIQVHKPSLEKRQPALYAREWKKDALIP
jgi:hypothetical protein